MPIQGCLLLYGTYLAGLTSNVSHPPVNQSPTILTVVTVVTISSAVAVPISIFLQAWPNLVYSAVAGAIFICTIATNCMLFVPQVRSIFLLFFFFSSVKKIAVDSLSSLMTPKLKAKFTFECGEVALIVW